MVSETGLECQSKIQQMHSCTMPILTLCLYKKVPAPIQASLVSKCKQQTWDSYEQARNAVGCKWIKVFSPWHQWHHRMISETLLQLQPDKESLLLYISAPPLSPCEERAWFRNIDMIKRTWNEQKQHYRHHVTWCSGPSCGSMSHDVPSNWFDLWPSKHCSAVHLSNYLVSDYNCHSKLEPAKEK